MPGPMLGKLKRIFYDGTAIALVKSDAMSRKTKTKSLIYKDGTANTDPLIEEVLPTGFSVTADVDFYYEDGGNFKTLNMAQFSGATNKTLAIKSILAGGDAETYSKSCILDLSDEHNVEDYSTAKVQFQAMGTRTLSVTT